MTAPMYYQQKFRHIWERRHENPGPRLRANLKDKGFRYSRALGLGILGFIVFPILGAILYFPFFLLFAWLNHH